MPFLKVIGIDKGGKSDPTMFIPFSPGASLCCGDDGSKTVVKRYGVALDVSSVTTVDDIRIDGVTKAFSAALATDTEAGRAAIVSEIKAYLKSLNYVGGAIFWQLISGTTYMLHIDYTDLLFEWIGASTNQFVPLDAYIAGHKNTTAVGFSVRVKKLGDGTYDVTIKTYDGGVGLSAFAVTYNAVSKTTTVPVSGSYTFNASAVLSEAETALIVSLTATGGSAVSTTITEKLSNYKG